ncbi:antitoxin [Hoyosella rhizosphaerae]|uniref:Antitoxin n=1 Tax=Hoyosella rhizosphaerae TaxID=1755582 RepID=A0A916TZD3_9ACTN|nr:antitoxin [Hoyosella rhizosphaerae]MBN4927114.1 antitoxin [Hoyosella rhizosphaerae]GGC53880.1 hypothetical protein GCM10011410_02820 [Hoyosella rhizosphaerae]
MGFGDMMNKAKGLAQKSPDKVRAAVDKAEDTIDQKTGGKYGDQIRQGGSVVQDKLGVTEQKNSDTGEADKEAPEAK